MCGETNCREKAATAIFFIIASLRRVVMGRGCAACGRQPPPPLRRPPAAASHGRRFPHPPPWQQHCRRRHQGTPSSCRSIEPAQPAQQLVAQHYSPHLLSVAQAAVCPSTQKQCLHGLSRRRRCCLTVKSRCCPVSLPCVCYTSQRRLATVRQRCYRRKCCLSLQPQPHYSFVALFRSFTHSMYCAKFCFDDSWLTLPYAPRSLSKAAMTAPSASTAIANAKGTAK